MENQVFQCPNCGSILVPGSNFCPQCGLQITQNAQDISIGKQIYQYIFSLILPPFGLVWAIKYIKSGSEQQKRVGIIIIAITVVSLLLSIWFVVGFFQNLNQQFSSYSNLGL